MARARNIKPGFFINEELVELPFSTRLLFIGLWTIADREGRLADRPKTIKMALFPADDLDVNTGLDELAKAGMIERYGDENKRFIQIINFSKHQHPHQNEPTSTIQAPEDFRASTKPIGKKTESRKLNPDNGKKKTENAATAVAPCPCDFTITPEMRSWAEVKVPTVDIDDELEEFVGYWVKIDNGKTKRTDAGWLQTWQNRMREIAKRHRPTKAKPKSGSTDMLSPDYVAPPFVLTFEIGMVSEPKPTTPERYEELKQQWRERHPDRADEEIAEYERGSDFRQRFGQTGQERDSPHPAPSRGYGNGIAEAPMPVPR